MFSTTSDGSASPVERLRITSAGLVGIGTTPDYPLDVNGAIRSDGTSGGLYFGGNSTTPSSGSAIHRPANDTLAFVTASTERMRITSGGDVLFGTTGIPNGSSIQGAAFEDTSNNRQVLKTASSVTTAGTLVAFYNPNGNVGTISTSGSATAYNTASDYRLKENVIALTGATDRLNQLQVRRFNFIADPDTVVDGFIAHEAQAVVPECVTNTKDEVDENGDPVYQGIDQSKLVPLLTAALQEAIGEIESLKARVAALESA